MELKQIEIKNQILGDGLYGSKLINGELVKIVIDGTTSAEIEIYTSDGELVFSGQGFEGKSVIYPKTEDGEHFYLLGNFIIEVEGLENENILPLIRFIYYGS